MHTFSGIINSRIQEVISFLRQKLGFTVVNHKLFSRLKRTQISVGFRCSRDKITKQRKRVSAVVDTLRLPIFYVLAMQKVIASIVNTDLSGCKLTPVAFYIGVYQMLISLHLCSKNNDSFSYFLLRYYSKRLTMRLKQLSTL